MRTGAGRCSRRKLSRVKIPHPSTRCVPVCVCICVYMCLCGGGGGGVGGLAGAPGENYHVSRSIILRQGVCLCVCIMCICVCVGRAEGVWGVGRCCRRKLPRVKIHHPSTKGVFVLTSVRPSGWLAVRLSVCPSVCVCGKNTTHEGPTSFTHTHTHPHTNPPTHTHKHTHTHNQPDTHGQTPAHTDR